MLALVIFVGRTFGYVYEPSVLELFGNVFLIAVFFFFQAALAVTINYIKELHASLTSTNLENLKLLNGMHEGLLILKKNE